MTYILLIIGFFLLIKGAGFLVDGASSIADRLKISHLVIGLTVVAFGTSAPELFVNLYASYTGATDIAIGNIIGSNIVNIFLILGVSAIIFPLSVTKGTVWKEIPLSLLAAVMVLIMANDLFLNKTHPNILSRSEGITLVAFFIIFLYYTFGIAKAEDGNSENGNEIKKYSIKKSCFLILAGLSGLVLGGQWIVSSATEIAKTFGISETLIGLTIVAIGTSLPELATSAMAAYKKNGAIAIGNVVGSNIFNVFWILGISAIIKPLPFKESANFDVIMAILASALLFGWMFLGKKHTLEKWQGVILILIYILYLIFIGIRG